MRAKSIGSPDFIYPNMTGWVKLHRSMLDCEWYSNANCVRLAVHLLLKACYKETEWRGITLLPGQVATSLSTLSYETGLSMRQTRTSLRDMQNDKYLTCKTTNKYSIITICDWDTYQDINSPDDTQNDKQTTRRTTSKRHAERQALYNKKEEYKEEKEEKKSSRTKVLEDQIGWRDDFEVYLQSCRDAWTKWVNDPEWMAERRRFNPGVDILLTLEKACKEFWATPAGWQHKKKMKSKTINWKTTFQAAISQKSNRVYLPKRNSALPNILRREDMPKIYTAD